MQVPPKRYFLVTACSLKSYNKDTVLQAMQPFIRATADIYGANELDALLAQHPAIYRKNCGLWLHNIEQLAIHHCCLIVGSPGMGKSTTAGQIALQPQIQTPSVELIWVDGRNFD
ncbi:ATP-binding protein [Marinobacter sp. LV10R520-4]|uniref:ATP-binding protein n=1 Tax=Marinobacter sp. LV10R520-4 TaxID=1761796 RepID=UPI000BF3B310|nr:ATP-binding protein [Marinobacter sp. LV10R520-4]